MNLEKTIQQLEQFKTIQCGMFHEKVLLDKMKQLPVLVSNDLSSGTTTLKRQSLCPNTKRAWYLGCAHSKSNQNFIQLLKTYAAQDKKLNSLLQSINALLLKVYQLDHRKGNLERDYALSLLPDTTLDTAAIQQQIAHAITIHQTYIEELETYKVAIIQRLKALDK